MGDKTLFHVVTSPATSKEPEVYGFRKTEELLCCMAFNKEPRVWTCNTKIPYYMGWLETPMERQPREVTNPGKWCLSWRKLEII